MTTTTRPTAQSGGSATSLAAIGAVVTTATNFGIALLLALEGTATAGVFFAATALATISGNSATLGSHTALVYFAPTVAQVDRPGYRQLLKIALTPVLVVATVLAVVGVAASGALGAAISSDQPDGLAQMIRIVSIAVPAWAITTALAGATRGLGTMTPTSVITQIGRPGGQLVGVAAVVLTGNASPTALALAWAVPVILGAVAAVWWTIRLGGLNQGDCPVTRPMFWAYCRPRAVSSALQIALERIDIVLISAILGDSAAGIYGSVTRFVAAGNFLIFSVAQANSPRLRLSIATERWQDAQHMMRQTTAWLVAGAGTYFLGVAAQSESLSRLFGEEYVAGADALRIAALGMVGSALAGPVDLGLLMTGRSGLSLVAAAAAVVTDLVGVVVLAPHWGMAGAAFAWALAVCVQNGLATIILRSVSPLMGPGRPAAIALVGAVLATLPAWLAPQNLAGLVISGLLAAVIGGSWLFWFRRQLGLDTAFSR